MTENMHPVVQLARQAVESYVKDGEVIRPRKLSPEMKERPAYLSLEKARTITGLHRYLRTD